MEQPALIDPFEKQKLFMTSVLSNVTARFIVFLDTSCSDKQILLFKQLILMVTTYYCYKDDEETSMSNKKYKMWIISCNVAIIIISSKESNIVESNYRASHQRTMGSDPYSISNRVA